MENSKIEVHIKSFLQSLSFVKSKNLKQGFCCFEVAHKRTKMLKSIIFDMDGVLVHTDNLHRLAWQQFADKLGIKFTAEMNNRMRGLSRADSLDVLLEKYPQTFSYEQKAEFLEEKNQIYLALCAEMSEKNVSPEVVKTLLTLKKMGLKLAVGSGSKNAHFILHKTRLEGYFDAITSGNEITHGKPNPEVFLNVANKLHVAPCECAVVEDAESGICAALACGMTTFAFGEAATQCNKAHFNLKSISDLIAYLEENNN